MAFSARGDSGVIKRGYQVAARLRRWTLEADRLDAEAYDVNQFWLGEHELPIVLSLQFGKKQWVWSDVQVLDSGSPFIVRIQGSPTVRD